MIMLQIPIDDFPKPWLLFNAMMAASLAYLVFALIRKWRGWSRGIPDEAARQDKNYRRPIMIWISEVLLQRQLYGLSSFRWFVHMLIFYGFIGLVLMYPLDLVLRMSGLLAVSDSMPRYYLEPTGYAVMKAWGDISGVTLLAGLVLAAIRRFAARPHQLNSNQMDLALLVLLILITTTGFVLEGLRLGLAPSGVAGYSLIGQFFVPSGLSSADIQAWLTTCWTFHAVLVALLIMYVPHSKLMHSLLAPAVIGMNALEEQERTDLYWPDIKKYKPTR